MTKKTIRNSLLLVLTAAIWGFAFVAQSIGGDAIGPSAFNLIRFPIGALVLLPFIGIRKLAGKDSRAPHGKKDRKNLILGGMFCGLALCVASSFQQFGITLGTSAGKAGFLTACYILIVPILGLFFKKRCGFTVWIGVAITLVGLYLLCMDGSFSVQFSDLLVLICALCFSVQILIVDHYCPIVDGVRLACIQFAFSGLFSIIPTFIFDMHCDISEIDGIINSLQNPNAVIPVLYAGVMSCGIAYTLQIVAQDGLNPTVASLLMSLESVFSVVGGCLILHQVPSLKEFIGCALMFVAICLAQIDPALFKKSRRIEKESGK